MRIRLAFFFLVSLIVPASVVGQVQDPSIQMGSAPYATFQNGDIDNVNLDNGNVFLKIPLVGFPQRGDKLSLNFFVRFNAPRWNVIEMVDGYDEGGDIVGQWSIYDFNGGPQPVGVDVVRDQFLSSREFVVPFVCTYAYECGYTIPPGAVPEPQDEYNSVGLFQVRTPDGGMHSYAMSSLGDDNVTVQTITPDGSHITSVQSDQGLNPYQFLDGSGVLYSGVSIPVSPYPGVPAAIVNAPAFNVSDPDGNQITVGANGWTDSIGRLIPGSFVGPGSATPGSTYANVTFSPEDDLMPGVPSSDYSKCSGTTTAARQWNVPSVNGSSQQYVFCYEDVSYQTAFNTTTICCYPSGTLAYAEASGAIRLLYEIVLPDNTNYQFSYDSYIDLTKITLPTGGSISYTWDSKAINPTLTSPLQRVVTSRTVVPGTSSPASSTGFWQYQWIISQYVYGSTPEDEYAKESILTDPNGNDTVHAIEPSDNESPDGASYTDISYSGRSPDNPSATGASGTVLKTVTSTRPSIWSPFYTDNYAEELTGPATSIVTSYPDGHATKVTNTFVPAQPILNYTWSSYNQNGGYPSPNVFYETYDCPCLNYDLATSTSTYAYGATSPGALISTTSTTYQWQNNAAYLTANLLTLPASIVTTDGQNRIAETDYSYDESPSPSGTRGHPTTVSRWLDTSNSFINIKTTFSSYGMPTDMYDANYLTSASTGNHVHTTYDSNGMYPTSISQSTTTNGVAHVDYYSYDFNTGLVLSHVDQNGSGSSDAAHMTTYHYVDPLNRLTSVIFPAITAGTPEVDFSYNSSTNTITKSELQGGGITLSSSYQYDGLGRTLETTDTAGALVDIVYDAVGHIASKSNPYVGTSTGQTAFLYDPFGRMTKQTDQDGSTEWFCYDGLPDPNAAQRNCHANYSSQIGEWVDVMDEDNSLTQHVQDSLGNLVEVSEFPSGPLGARLETDYVYYPTNNLKSVTQQGISSETPRQRSFTYDSLSRLLCASNPETLGSQSTQNACPSSATGTIPANVVSYGYDLNGNVTSKTDARNVATVYQYDALNRLVRKTVPVVVNTSGATNGYVSTCFQYDTFSGAPASSNLFGRLAVEWTQAGNQCASSYTLSIAALTAKVILNYDAMGRPLLSQQCITSMCTTQPFTQNQTYDLAGNMTSWTDGRGLMTFTEQYDSAGRPVSLTNSLSGGGWPSVLFSAQGYTPAGALQNWNVGNFLNFSRSYDNRLRITGETVTH